MIPQAAEDLLLKWLDNAFLTTGRDAAYRNWTLLLKATPLNVEMLSKGSNGGEGTNNQLIDMDIFEISEANTFDEPMYTIYKYYHYLAKFIQDDRDKDLILDMCPFLSRFLDRK